MLHGLGQSFSPVFWAKLTAETEKKHTNVASLELIWEYFSTETEIHHSFLSTIWQKGQLNNLWLNGVHRI